MNNDNERKESLVMVELGHHGHEIECISCTLDKLHAMLVIAVSPMDEEVKSEEEEKEEYTHSLLVSEIKSMTKKIRSMDGFLKELIGRLEL